jgi:hypothetical protein
MGEAIAVQRKRESKTRRTWFRRCVTREILVSQIAIVTRKQGILERENA